ncbi:SGNH hydrolase [Sporormia fimetaria CBS 119925]|uniref:SGNH hydrolase n=1 Tax=Sporormia fimetaria CBS 119925 TaxID=1340428 RepID=A0A6A6UYN2_9PLEO|nr:SGNH hydrolase [Sporormia fimetaria CBS 119925]
MPQLTEPANLPPAPFNATGAVFVNTTIRQTIKISLGASQFRLKVSNAFGTSPLPITAVTIAQSANSTAGTHTVLPSSLRKVTFSSSESITIPNGALAISDPIALTVPASTVLTISIYLASGQLSATNAITSHPGSRTTSFMQFGNAVSAPSLTITDPSTQSIAHWYFISSLVAYLPRSTGSLHIIGDSITDGRGSTTNANNRWPDLLFARLQREKATRDISIANLAAGGNRILADGLGPNAWSRISRDVLAHPNVKYVLIFEGVNDIGTADTTPSAQALVFEQLKIAYTQIVEQLHQHNLPVFGATITPFMAPANFTGQPYSHPEREKTRQKVNRWIREEGVFDEVVDFDAWVRDEEGSMLRGEFDSGDYLHPGVRGFEELAGRFPVGLFAKWEEGWYGV